LPPFEAESRHGYHVTIDDGFARNIKGAAAASGIYP
jgi:hypothetical protein